MVIVFPLFTVNYRISGSERSLRNIQINQPANSFTFDCWKVVLLHSSLLFDAQMSSICDAHMEYRCSRNISLYWIDFIMTLIMIVQMKCMMRYDKLKNKNKKRTLGYTNRFSSSRNKMKLFANKLYNPNYNNISCHKIIVTYSIKLTII